MTQEFCRNATHLPLVEEQDASPEVARLYAAYQERFGRSAIPGILRCFATHPPLLEHMMGIAEAMLFCDGALTRQQKEMVATFVSASNACPYCADSHGYFFRMEEGSEERLDALLQGNTQSPAFSAKESALLRFISLVNRGGTAVSPDEIAALRKCGWSNLQIAEAIHLAALFAAFNRVVNAFGVPSQQLLSTLDPRQ